MMKQHDPKPAWADDEMRPEGPYWVRERDHIFLAEWDDQGEWYCFGKEVSVDIRAEDVICPAHPPAPTDTGLTAEPESCIGKSDLEELKVAMLVALCGMISAEDQLRGAGLADEANSCRKDRAKLDQVYDKHFRDPDESRDFASVIERTEAVIADVKRGLRHSHPRQQKEPSDVQSNIDRAAL